jgi:type III secretion system-like peptide-binding chaperone
MISRRKFVAFLSAVSLVGKALAPNMQHNALLPPGHPAPECAEEAWAQFASELAHTLADLDEDEFLAITKKKDWYYVQFAAQGSFGMRAEATSNGYLNDDAKLSEQACAKLLNLGWNAPTYVPDDFYPERNDPDGSPNYFLQRVS